MRQLLNNVASVAALLSGCRSGADQTGTRTQETANYGRPTVFARGEGEQLIMRGDSPPIHRRGFQYGRFPHPRCRLRGGAPGRFCSDAYAPREG